ncbi:hypothetical protein BH11MYX4_BH11MYX4_68790 [soil metagenome]
MDTCSKCDRPAKYFRRVGTQLAFTCDHPQHLRAQGGDTNDWRGVGAMSGGLLATARVGAAAKVTAVRAR